MYNSVQSVDNMHTWHYMLSSCSEVQTVLWLQSSVVIIPSPRRCDCGRTITSSMEATVTGRCVVCEQDEELQHSVAADQQQRALSADITEVCIYLHNICIYRLCGVYPL